MKISNEKKKEILLKNFEIIKDNYVDNRNTLSDAVVKMFKIDIDSNLCSQQKRHCHILRL